MTDTQHPQLILTESDINCIGKVARDNKFDIQSTKIIYPETEAEELMFFVKSYRFLWNLKNSIKEEIITSEGIAENKDKDEVIKKINTYLLEIGDKYTKATELLFEYNTGGFYNNKQRLRNVFLFVKENKELIENLIDTIFPLGRIIKVYNPEDDIGYQS